MFETCTVCGKHSVQEPREAPRSLEGKGVRIVGMEGPFHLTYAGWDDQWIVKNAKGVDMLRCDGSEAEQYLTGQ